MTRANKARIKVKGLQPVQVLAGLTGIAFVVAGIVGFTRTGFGDFAGHHHATLLGFAINPLHNTVHLVAGLVGIMLATGSGLARFYGWLLLLGYGAAFVWGLMITGALSSNPVSAAGNPLDLNTADNWLHLGLAVLGLVIAMLPARKQVLIEEEEPAEVSEPIQADRTVTEPIPQPIPQPKHAAPDTHREQAAH
ncbi:protein of unknown function [Amycolatopsis xylanica]|uniref:DUF4383 domain-containing protein n=1 Tax=Amycolatopsis xylanica TaxID=589385 RepID=A0A1H3JVC5_9PSEU|nr:DUF4383 domain-containing protein [Amycolatopsis xylanica]SDY43204.1 protein of unknown function [Amycolatopsis xylanica]